MPHVGLLTLSPCLFPRYLRSTLTKSRREVPVIIPTKDHAAQTITLLWLACYCQGCPRANAPMDGFQAERRAQRNTLKARLDATHIIGFLHNNRGGIGGRLPTYGKSSPPSHPNLHPFYYTSFLAAATPLLVFGIKKTRTCSKSHPCVGTDGKSQRN